MKIIESVIKSEFTNACNQDALESAVFKMKKEGKEKAEVTLSYNLLDPDIYAFEYSPEDEMLTITRKGTSLTENDELIGATGLIHINSDHDIKEAVRDVLGLNKKEFTACSMNGRKVDYSISKSWWMLQDEEEDIFFKAFADVNASHIWTKDEFINDKIRALHDIQRYIRECRTAHGAFTLTATLAGDLDTFLVAFNGKDFGLYKDAETALQIVLALTKGYISAKEENLSPEYIGCLMDVFDDFLEEKEIVIESSVNEMVESGEYSKNDAENGIMGCRTCIYGSDYDRLATGLRKVAGI